MNSISIHYQCSYWGKGHGLERLGCSHSASPPPIPVPGHSSQSQQIFQTDPASCSFSHILLSFNSRGLMCFPGVPFPSELPYAEKSLTFQEVSLGLHSLILWNFFFAEGQVLITVQTKVRQKNAQNRCDPLEKAGFFDALPTRITELKASLEICVLIPALCFIPKQAAGLQLETGASGPQWSELAETPQLRQNPEPESFPSPGWQQIRITEGRKHIFRG